KWELLDVRIERIERLFRHETHLDGFEVPIHDVGIADAADARPSRRPHLIGAVADRAQDVRGADHGRHDRELSARFITIFSTLRAFRSHGTAPRHVKHARLSSGSIERVSRLAGGSTVDPASVTATIRCDFGTVKTIGP